MLTLSDLTRDLVWPHLLRAGSLALRPSRLGFAAVFILGLLLLGWLAGALDNSPGNALLTSGRVLGFDAVVAAAGERGPGEHLGERPARQLHDAGIATPALYLRQNPGAAIIVLPLIALWTALLGGAISRSAACEFGQGVMLEWPGAAGFALSRWRSLLFALVTPLLLVWGIALGLSLVGGALFRWPLLNVLGGAAWGLFLLVGFVAALVMIVLLLGWPLLVPAVACEGADAVDAVQHAGSFVLARPLRLVVYLAILLLQLLLVVAIAATICWLAVHIAQRCALTWSGWRGEHALSDLPLHEGLPHPASAETGVKAAHWLAVLWSLIPALLPAAVAVSFVWCGATVLYLAMRKIVDGQDVREVWMPGVVEGTRAAAHAGPLSPPPLPPMPESVSDTGPADES